MNDRLGQYKIPVDLPLVVQVSRFDLWKDPQGVVEAFKLAQKEVDATLVCLAILPLMILKVLAYMNIWQAYVENASWCYPTVTTPRW
jgi:hypothetical protein